MSTPRPAMFVATVTEPVRPAWATMYASRSCCFAFKTLCGMPRRFRYPDSRSDHGHVGRDPHDPELVDLFELPGLGPGRTGHPGELLVHPEVVLDGDGGEGLVLLLDPNALLGF